MSEHPYPIGKSKIKATKAEMLLIIAGQQEELRDAKAKLEKIRHQVTDHGFYDVPTMKKVLLKILEDSQ